MKFYKNIIIIILFLLINFNLNAIESDKVNTSSSDFETSNYEDKVYDPLEPLIVQF